MKPHKCFTFCFTQKTRLFPSTMIFYASGFINPVSLGYDSTLHFSVWLSFLIAFARMPCPFSIAYLQRRTEHWWAGDGGLMATKSSAILIWMPRSEERGWMANLGVWGREPANPLSFFTFWPFNHRLWGGLGLFDFLPARLFGGYDFQFLRSSVFKWL